jgi:hypothetical protein
LLAAWLALLKASIARKLLALLTAGPQSLARLTAGGPLVVSSVNDRPTRIEHPFSARVFDFFMPTAGDACLSRFSPRVNYHARSFFEHLVEKGCDGDETCNR